MIKDDEIRYGVSLLGKSLETRSMIKFVISISEKVEIFRVDIERKPLHN